MKTTINEQNDLIIAVLEGSFDTAASEQAANDLAPLHECKDRDVLIDCTDLTYICSSGLRILLGIRKSAAAAGRNVTLSHVNADIRDVLMITGFQNLFNIE